MAKSKHKLDTKVKAIIEAMLNESLAGLPGTRPKKELEEYNEAALQEAWRTKDVNYFLERGQYFYFGQGKAGKVDIKQAVFYLNYAAELGSSQALNMLGHCYLTGALLKKDLVKAQFYLEAAAELGDSDAMCKLGDIHFYGLGEAELDPDRGLEYYLKAYENMKNSPVLDAWVYPEICLRLADCYAMGFGLENDFKLSKHFYSEAVLYFRELVEAGDDSAKRGFAKAMAGLVFCKSVSP